MDRLTIRVNRFVKERDQSKASILSIVKVQARVKARVTTAVRVREQESQEEDNRRGSS